jgi:hypothetical protein
MWGQLPPIKVSFRPTHRRTAEQREGPGARAGRWAAPTVCSDGGVIIRPDVFFATTGELRNGFFAQVSRNRLASEHTDASFIRPPAHGSQRATGLRADCSTHSSRRR